MHTLSLFSFLKSHLESSPSGFWGTRVAIERAVIVSQGKQLKLDDWLPHTNTKPNAPAIVTLEDMARQHILKVLELTGWRISGERGAARILNVNASTLRSRMEKLGIKK